MIGRGGSRRGRKYPRTACPKCGAFFGSNVKARHVELPYQFITRAFIPETTT